LVGQAPDRQLVLNPRNTFSNLKTSDRSTLE